MATLTLPLIPVAPGFPLCLCLSPVLRSAYQRGSSACSLAGVRHGCGRFLASFRSRWSVPRAPRSAGGGLVRIHKTPCRMEVMVRSCAQATCGTRNSPGCTLHRGSGEHTDEGRRGYVGRLMSKEKNTRARRRLTSGAAGANAAEPSLRPVRHLWMETLDQLRHSPGSVAKRDGVWFRAQARRSIRGTPLGQGELLLLPTHCWGARDAARFLRRVMGPAECSGRGTSLKRHGPGDAGVQLRPFLGLARLPAGPSIPQPGLRACGWAGPDRDVGPDILVFSG